MLSLDLTVERLSTSEVPVGPGVWELNLGPSRLWAGQLKQQLGREVFEMPVRQTRVFVQSDEPVDGWAETLIGRVFRPLTNEFSDELNWFWFSRYLQEATDSADCDISLTPDEYKRPLDSPGVPHHRSMRLRFSISDPLRCSAFEQRAREVIDVGGYRISDFRDYDYVADTGSNRFLGVENRQPGRAKQRAILATTFYCAISKLVVDAIVGPDDHGRFRMETNDDLNQNPRRSTFQSFLHLFCNITDVPTDVYVFHKVSMNLVGFGTFITPPPVSLPDGWDQQVEVYQIRY